MSWKQKGLIFNVNGEHDWNKSHAQCPVVDVVNEAVWRIYYASRNTQGQSQISYIEVEAGKPEHILYEHPNYLFELGPAGCFDDSGVMPSCVVRHAGVIYLYYIGWTLKRTVPYHNSIGVAKSTDNGQSFTRVYPGSIMPAIATEPYFTGTSYVLKEGALWRMWYLSCVRWAVMDGQQEPYYHIKYAESDDGLHWRRHGHVAIDFKSPDEGGLVSASVQREGSIYKMWYAYRAAQGYRTERNKAYRIGYAESLDGLNWERLDARSGMSLPDSGWDCDMQAYPYVIRHEGQYYMFYNGNGFGQSGIGYAISQ